MVFILKKKVVVILICDFFFSLKANPPSESVLQKFRKSFSLRFHKTNKGTLKDDSEEAEDLPEDVNEEEALHLQQKNNFQNIKEDNNNTDQKFRYEGCFIKRMKLHLGAELF